MGVSVRTVRRWEERFDANGAEGLYDRRLGKMANNRVPTDTAISMLELFDTKYWDYTPKHFHEKLVDKHGFTQSLQLGPPDLAEAWSNSACAAAWRPPSQAASAPDGWHDAASGRVDA